MLLINTKTKCPIYEQLYMQIRDKIMTDEWKFNMKLPSSRQLARELQISRNTVEQAYQQLYAEGYLFSKPRIGYYVEQLNTTFINQQSSCETGEKIGQNTAKSQYRYDFRYGKLDYRYVPFKIWKNLMMKCFGEEMDGLASYGGHQGESGLREQIVKYAAEYRGVKCNPEQIIVGAGTLYCLEMLCNLLRQTTNTVSFEDPGYGRARAVFKSAGFKVCPINVDKDGLNIQELDNNSTTAVYVTPSHQFPTGAIMSISKRLQLIEWATRKEAVIIEDDYSCHFRYNTRPIPALQGISQTANVVYLGNFSKSLLPSLRLAFMVLPLSLLDSYKRSYEKYNTSVPYLFQKTLEEFMRDGYLDRHLHRVLQVYKKKHDFLIQCLHKEFDDKIKIAGKNAGLFITVKVNSDLFEAQLIHRAAKLGVRVYPISDHWERVKQYDGKMVLLGYSSLDVNEIEQGVHLLRKAWFG